jgi:hypothetical protein
MDATLSLLSKRTNPDESGLQKCKCDAKLSHSGSKQEAIDVKVSFSSQRNYSAFGRFRETVPGSELPPERHRVIQESVYRFRLVDGKWCEKQFVLQNGGIDLISNVQKAIALADSGTAARVRWGEPDERLFSTAAPPTAIGKRAREENPPDEQAPGELYELLQVQVDCSPTPCPALPVKPGSH